MVNVSASSVVDRVVEPPLGQSKTMKLIFVASLLSTLRSRCKNWLARNLDNVYEQSATLATSPMPWLVKREG